MTKLLIVPKDIAGDEELMLLNDPDTLIVCGQDLSELEGTYNEIMLNDETVTPLQIQSFIYGRLLKENGRFINFIKMKEETK